MSFRTVQQLWITFSHAIIVVVVCWRRVPELPEFVDRWNKYRFLRIVGPPQTSFFPSSCAGGWIRMPESLPKSLPESIPMFLPLQRGLGKHFVSPCCWKTILTSLGCWVWRACGRSFPWEWSYFLASEAEGVSKAYYKSRVKKWGDTCRDGGRVRTSQCRDERPRRGLILCYPLKRRLLVLQMDSCSSGQLHYSRFITSLWRRLPSPDTVAGPTVLVWLANFVKG